MIVGQLVPTGTLSLYIPSIITVPPAAFIMLRRRKFRDFVYATMGEAYSEAASASAWYCAIAAGAFAAALSGFYITTFSFLAELLLGYFGVIGIFYLWRSGRQVSHIGESPSRVSVPGLFPEKTLPSWVSGLTGVVAAALGLAGFILVYSFYIILGGVIVLLTALTVLFIGPVSTRLYGNRIVTRYSDYNPTHFWAAAEIVLRRLSKLLLIKKVVREFPLVTSNAGRLLEYLTETGTGVRTEMATISRPPDASASKVFICYGGSKALGVGLEMADCLFEHGLWPRIAATGSRWSIGVSRQELIFREELTCQAVLAINAEGSFNKEKFWDEVDLAKYETKPSIPIIAFLCNDRGGVIMLLRTGCHRVRFDPGRHKEKCRDVAEAIKDEVSRANSAKRVDEDQLLPIEELGQRSSR
jgi:hypothetical protein